MSMGEAGITLYVIACEPTLSQNYKGMRDFYQGLVKKTVLTICDRGKVVELSDLSVLPTLIAGSALEAVNSEIYVVKHQTEVCSIYIDTYKLEKQSDIHKDLKQNRHWMSN
ncbi:hypothetical protein BDR07DRAFT_1381320 [Suillus spraguei]|nr:hypothetical protein BDR07DRAFT_1381320 [Suillus spraguei]